MKYLKLFEAYYGDLTPYGYSGVIFPKCVNIGFLDSEHEFEKGDVPVGFLDKFKELPLLSRSPGWHECEFCDDKKNRERLSGSIRVAIGDDIVYCSPDLVYHYVKDHQYRPPQEYIDTVMNMEKTSDKEAADYINNILKNSPEFLENFKKRRNK